MIKIQIDLPSSIVFAKCQISRPLGSRNTKPCTLYIHGTSPTATRPQLRIAPPPPSACTHRLILQGLLLTLLCSNIFRPSPRVFPPTALPTQRYSRPHHPFFRNCLSHPS